MGRILIFLLPVIIVGQEVLQFKILCKELLNVLGSSSMHTYYSWDKLSNIHSIIAIYVHAQVYFAWLKIMSH